MSSSLSLGRAAAENRLLKRLSGLLAPSRGEILFRGPWLDGPPEGIGMAFQDPLLLPWRNVINNVLLPIEILHLARGRFKKAIDLLVIVGLQVLSGRRPGSFRRDAAACELVPRLINDPQVLLMDEPFGALDAFTREELWLVP